MYHCIPYRVSLKNASTVVYIGVMIINFVQIDRNVIIYFAKDEAIFVKNGNRDVFLFQYIKNLRE